MLSVTAYVVVYMISSSNSKPSSSVAITKHVVYRDAFVRSYYGLVFFWSTYAQSFAMSNFGYVTSTPNAQNSHDSLARKTHHRLSIPANHGQSFFGVRKSDCTCWRLGILRNTHCNYQVWIFLKMLDRLSAIGHLLHEIVSR